MFGALSGLSHCLPAEFTQARFLVTLLSDNAHVAIVMLTGRLSRGTRFFCKIAALLGPCQHDCDLNSSEFPISSIKA